MALVINTNVMSLNAQRNLVNTGNSLATSLERLSSGLRINSAKDDAAGLGIAQKQQGLLLSLNQAVRNANDGISMIQTAESAMNEVQSMMQRMRELATQASSDTVGATERGFINDELTQLVEEINNIATRTEFNDQKLLTGSLSTSINTATSEMVAGSSLVAATGTSVTAVDVSGAAAGTTFTFTNPGAPSATVTLSDGTTSQSVTVGVMAAASTQVLNFDQLGIKVTVASADGDAAADIAAGFAVAANDTIITAAGSAAAILQVGGEGDSFNQITVNFNDLRLTTSNSDADIAALRTALDNYNSSQTQATAESLLNSVDAALNSVSSQRSELGAKQNRLGYTISSVMAASENVASARSRIVDADFAMETANLTRNQILQQAGTAMLAQANSLPQNVLALLQ
jgi:flagellin